MSHNEMQNPADAERIAKIHKRAGRWPQLGRTMCVRITDPCKQSQNFWISDISNWLELVYLRFNDHVLATGKSAIFQSSVCRLARDWGELLASRQTQTSSTNLMVSLMGQHGLVNYVLHVPIITLGVPRGSSWAGQTYFASVHGSHVWIQALALNMLQTCESTLVEATFRLASL